MNCPMCGELWNDVKCEACGWFEGKQARWSEPPQKRRRRSSPSVAAVDPQVTSTGKMSTRDASSLSANSSGQVAASEAGSPQEKDREAAR
jgi:hypothetical protein